MNRAASTFVGAIVEAWSELRIHRTRVLLSLIGIAVAVAAITVTVGGGALVTQASTEQNERSSGRPAMLSLGAYSEGDGMSAPPALLQEAYETARARYSVEFASRNTYISESVQLPTGVLPVSGLAVDVDYGTMHRIAVDQGRWFTAADQALLAPAVIINDDLWNAMGSPDLRVHPTVEILGERSRTATIVGITRSSTDYDQPEMTMLFDDWQAGHSETEQAAQGATYEFWVPPAIAEELRARLEVDVQSTVGDEYVASVYRGDYLSYAGEDPLLGIKLAIGGIAALVLLLGALGLVNIALVTVRQRIREIGIRRSFGATAGRVFFSVMMESVVASVAAGVIGVFIAVAVVQNPIVQERLANGLIDVPPFPIEAAILGLVCSAVVGALAGLLPALVAVRVKVIDAIRY